MKQIDIFENEVDVEEIDDDATKVKHPTLKEKFRAIHGYNEDYQCKNCIYFNKFNYHGKTFNKCQKLGYTHSKATDISPKQFACNLYKEE